MIIEILGWKFVDKADADMHIAEIDLRLGYPNGDTLHYCFYSDGYYDGVNFYWLPNDVNVWEDLGEPYNFFIDNGL